MDSAARAALSYLRKMISSGTSTSDRVSQCKKNLAMSVRVAGSLAAGGIRMPMKAVFYRDRTAQKRSKLQVLVSISALR